ncbi:MAG: cytochrome P450 [Thermonemataceae bacterium]|nr:cytochrome P450 [Thermonemataceae bacterium]
MIKEKKMPAPTEKQWLLGNLGKFYQKPLTYIAEAKQEVGDIFEIKSPFGKLIAIANPAYIKHVLQDNNKNYHKGMAYRVTKPLLGEGLLTSEGEFWRKQRRLIQPAFHKAKLENLFDIMQETTKTVIEEWKKTYKNGDKINISKEMNRLALLIVSKSLFQSDISAEIDTISDNLEKSLERAIERIKKPWLLPVWIPTLANLREQKIQETLKGVVRKIIEQRKSEQVVYDDLLDMLMQARDEENENPMTEQQLLDEVMTIFLAGHETTANALAYSFLLLTQHQEEGQKVFEEVKNLLGREPLSYVNSRSLEYTKLVIQETLRMYPPAWVITRFSLAEDQIGEYKIDAETGVVINIFTMHHLEEYWDKPEEFIPERFKTEKFKNLPKFVYLPFGGGPRICIGEHFAFLEMTTILSLISQSFFFKEIREYKLELLPLLTLRPKEDIELYIYHRE